MWTILPSNLSIVHFNSEHQELLLILINREAVCSIDLIEKLIRLFEDEWLRARYLNQRYLDRREITLQNIAYYPSWFFSSLEHRGAALLRLTTAFSIFCGIFVIPRICVLLLHFIFAIIDLISIILSDAFILP